MFNRIRFSIVLVVVVVVLAVSTSLVAAQQATVYTVVFRGNNIPQNAAQIVAQAGGQLVNGLPQVGVGFAVSSDPSFAANLRGSQSVVAAGEMQFQRAPNPGALPDISSSPTAADDLYPNQWDIRRVHADSAWNAGVSGSHNTVVSVIDTGVAWNHPDLTPNIVYAACYNLTSLAGGSCNPYPELHWHGTHVAGTVAGAFGGGRIVGVGPNLGIAGYDVFEIYNDPEDGPVVVAFDGPIWMAMIDTAARGFDVINMSLGGFVVFPTQGSADAAAWTAWNRVANYVHGQGVTIVASAGNENLSLNGPYAHIPSDLPDVISVGATGIRPEPTYPQDGAYDVRAFYSNLGAAVTLVAPGGDCGLPSNCNPATRPANWFDYLVLSSYVDVTQGNGNCSRRASCPTGYAWAAGTSMASPHVAGVAGLVIDSHPGLSPDGVETILNQTAEAIGSSQTFGHGMVNAAAATGY